MKKSYFIGTGIFCCFMIIMCALILHNLSNGSRKNILNTVDVNDVAKSIMEDCSEAEVIRLADEYGFGIAVFDKQKDLLYKSDEECVDSLVIAQSNCDCIVTNEKDGIILGYVVIMNSQSENVSNEYDRMRTIVVVLAVLVIIMSVVFTVYMYRRIVKPFDKLKEFASYVAMGKLDIPLKMDRGNLFGAFTESFDIMREELLAARRKEQEAIQSKKELVASLSHDIKTPVASIKATAQLLEIIVKDDKAIDKIKAIDAKADQIEMLINNLFHVTLEELNELNVQPGEEISKDIAMLIKGADYENRVVDYELPECIVVCDRLRLGQVFDNIIANSYKYADTDITVSGAIDEGYLCISIRDYGQSLTDEEIALCCKKFWRGSNAEGKNGAGIGLYISTYFCEKMGGKLIVSKDDGFKVTVCLRLA